jgi:hypothetical protein
MLPPDLIAARRTAAAAIVRTAVSACHSTPSCASTMWTVPDLFAHVTGVGRERWVIVPV